MSPSDSTSRLPHAVQALDCPVALFRLGTGYCSVLPNSIRLNRSINDAEQRVYSPVFVPAISEAAAPHGPYYAPDPSSQIACSTAVTSPKLWRSPLSQIRPDGPQHPRTVAVTTDGDRITIGAQTPDSPGYDPLALMTGSEGMLGVIVEITVKLLPKPASARALLAAFDSVEEAGAAVGNIIAEGIIPGG